MTKPVSTKTHGVLDYASVPMLLALPRLFGWSPPVRTLLTVAGLGTLFWDVAAGEDRWDERACAILGVPADATFGPSLLGSIVHADDRTLRPCRAQPHQSHVTPSRSWWSPVVVVSTWRDRH